MLIVDCLVLRVSVKCVGGMVPGVGIRVSGVGGWGESSTDRYSSPFENNYFTKVCSGSEAGSHSRLIELCVSLESRRESHKEEEIIYRYRL